MTSPEQADVEAMREECKRLAEQFANQKIASGTMGARDARFALFAAIDRLAAVALHPQPPDVHLAQAQGQAPAAQRSSGDEAERLALTQAFNAGRDFEHERQAALQAQALAPRDAWREHVEQRLRTWRQRTVNRSGDQLALDDFMDKDSLDDLIDFVCDEWAGPQGEQDDPKGIPPPKMTIAGEGPDRGHWWSGSEPNEQNWYEQNVSAEGIEEASKP
jgi:hypothetical protein